MNLEQFAATQAQSELTQESLAFESGLSLRYIQNLSLASDNLRSKQYLSCRLHSKRHRKL